MEHHFYTINVKTFPELHAYVRRNKMELIFYLNPLTVEDIHQGLETGILFQPHSTFIRPKLPNCLLTYPF